jgi:hypothetical protein
MKGAVQVVPLELSTAELSVSVGAGVVDRVGDALDTNQGNRVPSDLDDQAATFDQRR